MYVEGGVEQQTFPPFKVPYTKYEIDSTFWYKPTAVHAYKISVISCVITFLAFIIGLIAFNAAQSPAMLGFALENIVDLMSSMVVVWRFYAGGADLSPEVVEKMDRREKRASILIAVILFVLGITVMSVAVGHLVEENHGDNVGLLIGLSFPSLLVFGGLAVVKFRMSDMLGSPSFKKDAACSLFGAILSFGVFFGSCIKSGDDGGES